MCYRAGIYKKISPKLPRGMIDHPLWHYNPVNNIYFDVILFVYSDSMSFKITKYINTILLSAITWK